MIHSLLENKRINERHQQMRESIQAAALVCFSAKGLTGATMAEIARIAGMSPGTIYLHFKNKQELFESLGKPELAQPDVRIRVRRKKILQAALKAFSEKGYAATTMEEIAILAGLSKAAIYMHFESKAELFLGVFKDSSLLSVLERSFDCKRAKKWQEVSSTHDFEKFIIELVNAFLNVHNNPEHIDVLRLILSESMHDSEIADIVVEKMSKGTASELAKRLAKFNLGKVCELLPLAEIVMSTMFAWVLMHQLLARPKNRNKSQPTQQAAKQIAHLLLYGLAGYKEERIISSRASKKRKV
ncbi:MAG: TetR family transcriptional regulator [Deltaproteobacteria bacterium]|nr:TetR family transcriptional regulator [Deltaproteobacteria bacterium]